MAKTTEKPPLKLSNYKLQFHAFHGPLGQRDFQLHVRNNQETSSLFATFGLNAEGELENFPKLLPVTRKDHLSIFHSEFEIADDILLSRTIPIAHWVNETLSRICLTSSADLKPRHAEDVCVFEAFDKVNINASRPSLRQFCKFKGSAMHKLVSEIGVNLVGFSYATTYTNSPTGLKLDTQYLDFQVAEIGHSFKDGAVYPHW